MIEHGTIPVIHRFFGIGKGFLLSLAILKTLIIIVELKVWRINRLDPLRKSNPQGWKCGAAIGIFTMLAFLACFVLIRMDLVAKETLQPIVLSITLPLMGLGLPLVIICRSNKLVRFMKSKLPIKVVV